jgi:DNA-binding MarR family transcriptional regulator
MMCRGRGCKMHELSVKLRLSTAAITGIADSLEEARLLEREVTRNDRRSYTLKTTKLGMDFLRKFGDVV